MQGESKHTPDHIAPSKNYRTLVLLILTLIYAFNFIDRQILGILSPIIQKDLGLDNFQMGLLKGFLFALFYTTIGIPIAWLADRYNRVNIVSISLAVWSGFTVLTGMANSFLTIGLARMGVGIGEAGGSPPSHSIISDMYSKDERSSALAIYALGIPLGLGFAYFIAGYMLGGGSGITWRQLLIGLGISGILLAIVARLVIREPLRGSQEGRSGNDIQIPFKDALKILLSIKSWWAMCMGIALASFVGYGVSLWQIDYLLPFDASQGEASYGFRKFMYVLAFTNVVFYGGGTFFGGFLAERLAGKSVAYYAIVPAISILICIPLTIAAFWVPSTTGHLAVGAILLFFLGMYLGPSFAIAQTLAPINMRAMSTALFFLILNLIALGGGPTTVGYLADMFKDAHGQVHAIRLAITVCSFAFILSTISFLIAAKTLPKDWAQAQKRNEGTA